MCPASKSVTAGARVRGHLSTAACRGGGGGAGTARWGRRSSPGQGIKGSQAAGSGPAYHEGVWPGRSAVRARGPVGRAGQSTTTTTNTEQKKRREAKAYSTRYSQAVSHPSTNQARPCLASEIRRDRALSGWYGRRRLTAASRRPKKQRLTRLHHPPRPRFPPPPTPRDPAPSTLPAGPTGRLGTPAPGKARALTRPSMPLSRIGLQVPAGPGGNPPDCLAVLPVLPKSWDQQWKEWKLQGFRLLLSAAGCPGGGGAWGVGVGARRGGAGVGPRGVCGGGGGGVGGGGEGGALAKDSGPRRERRGSQAGTPPPGREQRESRAAGVRVGRSMVTPACAPGSGLGWRAREPVGRATIKRKAKAYCTRYSQAVSLPSPHQARPLLSCRERRRSGAFRVGRPLDASQRPAGGLRRNVCPPGPSLLLPIAAWARRLPRRARKVA